MKQFEYEWWTVDILYDAGLLTTEFKGKSKDHIIKQIQKEIAYTNSKKNTEKSVWERKNVIKAVYWETLKLDRKGYARKF